MIFKVSEDDIPLPKYSGAPDVGFENLGHNVSLPKSTMEVTPNSAANIHGGAGNQGFGFATDAEGCNDYPRPDGDYPKIPGA
jgi:hypothetical protein